MIDPGLCGRVVLITGANNPLGIGAATAEAFARAGARVFLHYYRDPRPGETDDDDAPGEALYCKQQAKAIDEVIDRVGRHHVPTGAYEADLADAAATRLLFAEVERQVGAVDVLVNNAAAWVADTFVPHARPTRHPWLELWTTRGDSATARTFDTQFLVNARAPALLMSEFARRLVERGASWGRIVSVSTDGAECFPGEISYGASKAALESYTRSAAVELGQFGVTANIVSLGPVQTGWITPALEQRLRPTIPLGRIGHPNDIADVVVFLASEQARWVTGQRIFVGGGHAM